MNEEGDTPGGSEIDKSQQELTVNRMNTRSKIIELATSAQAIRLYSLSFLIASIVCFFSIDEIVEMFLIPAKNLFVLFINSFSIILIFKLIKKEDGTEAKLTFQLSEMKSEIDTKSGEIENLNEKSEAWKQTLATIDRVVDFENPDDPSHDVTFVLKFGRKVYANTQRLSAHSSVFLKLFSGDFSEKNQKEIELKNIAHDYFIAMLNMIYNPSTKIKDWFHATLLISLGRRFKIDWIVDKGEKWLITDLPKDPDNWFIIYHLDLASRYDLVVLQNHCLNQLKTIEDVVEVKNEEYHGRKYYDDFSDDIKAALEQKIKDFSH